MKKEVSQNIFFLPLVLSIIQYCFLFVALINSGYYFANKVLLVSFLIVLVWIGLFLNATRYHKSYKNIQNIILLIMFCLIAFYCIRMTWFSHYLSIGAIDDFFKGKTFIDPLYHSTLAQSIVTNGYPSVQQNAPVFLFYHSFAHYLIAYLSIFLSLPCFITLNYLFPVLIIPLFLYLLQKSTIIAKNYLKKIKQLTIADYFLIGGLVFSFGQKKFLDKIGFVNYSYLLSESCLISIVLMLVYLCIINWGYSKYKSFYLVNFFFLIPLFILGLSFAKISTGCIFCAGICYFIFRKYKILSFNILLVFLYAGVFGGYYYLSGKFPASYPANDTVAGNFTLFHYILNYSKNPLWGIFHYIFYFLPIVLIVFYNHTQRLFIIHKPCSDKTTLFVELVIVLALIGCLPGILLQIEGGSAFYFYIPVYFLSWLLFIGTTTLSAIENKMAKWKYKGEVTFFSKNDTICKINLLVFIFIFTIIPLTLSQEAGNKRIYTMIKTTVASRIDPSHFRKEFKSKIVKLFEPVNLIKDKNYIIFNDIINRTKNSKADYCIFISDNSLINRYDYYTRGYSGRNRLLYGNLAITAYLGIPIINSLYIKNDIFYRGDKLKLGKLEDIAGYSMPPIICGDRVTDENMIEYAKKIGKKKIIILENNSYKIVDVK